MGDNSYDPLESEFSDRPVRRHSRAGVVSVALALVGITLIVIIALHVRADHTQRRPVVTWVGPAAAWIGTLAWTWFLSTSAAMFFGAIGLADALREKNRRMDFCVLGLILASISLAGGCIFDAAVFED